MMEPSSLGSANITIQPSQSQKFDRLAEKEVYNNNAVEDTFEVYAKPESGKDLTRWQKFKQSFERADENEIEKPGPMSTRHLRLLALACGVGTGLFVGSGSKLATGGPASLLVAYFIVGIPMLTPTIFSAGELSVTYPKLTGGFQSYFAKFIDESASFALGWNYLIQWLCTISLELVTASITIKYWNTELNSDIFVAIFMVVIISINLCGARGYAEAEFFMNSTKLLTLTGFILFGLIVDVGGTDAGFIGGKFWRDPGAFTDFKGFCTVGVTACFSFGGTEFISLSVADQAYPRRAMKSCCKLVMFRVVFFFMTSLLFVGLLVPYNSPQLMGSGSSATHASAFVIATETYAKGLSHVINAVILISVTSVATSAMYSSPRLLLSLAQQGLAPKYFDYVDKSGRPLRAWILSIVASFFAFIATYENQEAVFNWLLSISAISFLFVWPAICFCHIRFRSALKLNNISLKELGYVSPTGLIGSYSSILINILLLIAQFWVALFPDSNGPNASSFFENYLGAVVIVVLYLGHKIWTRNWKILVPLSEIDIDKDRSFYDLEVMMLEKEEEKEKFKQANIVKKLIMLIS